MKRNSRGEVEIFSTFDVLKRESVLTFDFGLLGSEAKVNIELSRARNIRYFVVNSYNKGGTVLEITLERKELKGKV